MSLLYLHIRKKTEKIAPMYSTYIGFDRVFLAIEYSNVPTYVTYVLNLNSMINYRMRKTIQNGICVRSQTL